MRFKRLLEAFQGSRPGMSLVRPSVPPKPRETQVSRADFSLGEQGSNNIILEGGLAAITRTLYLFASDVRGEQYGSKDVAVLPSDGSYYIHSHYVRTDGSIEKNDFGITIYPTITLASVVNREGRDIRTALPEVHGAHAVMPLAKHYDIEIGETGFTARPTRGKPLDVIPFHVLEFMRTHEYFERDVEVLMILHPESQNNPLFTICQQEYRSLGPEMAGGRITDDTLDVRFRGVPQQASLKRDLRKYFEKR